MDLEDQSEEHQLSVIQTAACCCDDIALEAEDESSTKTIEWISHELEAPSSASSIKKRFIRWEDMMDVSFASARRELVLDHLDAEISSGQQESDSQRKMVRYHPCGIYGAVVEVQQEGNMGSGESSLEVKVGNMKATATSELRHGGWRETSITCERYVSGRGRMAKYEIVCRFRRRGGAASPSLNRSESQVTNAFILLGVSSRAARQRLPKESIVPSRGLFVLDVSILGPNDVLAHAWMSLCANRSSLYLNSVSLSRR
eukprot:6207215-Pleurochrysis_carterae.AAC.2